MSLVSGQILTHYEILSPLGSGAMGEVYRARDTRLEREVAIKVLPEELARDEERLRRFEREAKTLASLSHPNLAHVYGIDKVEDTLFMVMELVPGEDLATRLTRDRISVDEAIDVCRQIAEGLEAAHESGVIHRDLKPANVRVTPAGIVKILDFGLAKPLRPSPTPDGFSAAEPDSISMTNEGLVLGTPMYMSPEQARGKPVDRRTDVWALGCVLYECLTGRRAFAGESVTDVLAAIVGQEPNWSLLPALPVRVEELQRRALIKDSRLRLRDAGEARVQLTLAADEPEGVSDPERPPLNRRSRGFVFALAIFLAAVSFAVGLWLGDGPAPVTGLNGGAVTVGSPAVHAMLQAMGEDEFPRQVRISPDATVVAWANKKGLHLRELGEVEFRTIHENPRQAWPNLAWSPDGKEIAFIEEGALWRIPVEDGSPRRFADYDGFPWSDLQWLPDGRIAYGVEEGIAALTEEGERTMLVEVDNAEIAHLHGFFVLPDGESALVVPHLVPGGALTIELLRDGRRKEIVSPAATEPGLIQMTPDGSLYWTEDARGVLWRLSVSLDDFEPLGPSEIVAEDCYRPSLSMDGILVYVCREGEETSEVGWIDRAQGSYQSLEGEHSVIAGAMFSPDGRQIVFTTTTHAGGGSETWLHDFDRGLSTVQIQRDDGNASSIFLPDGRIGLIPYNAKTGTLVYPPSGKGDPELLPGAIVAVSRDGRIFVTSGWSLPGQSQYHVSGPGIEGGERLLLGGAHGEEFHGLSGDDAWMLYSSRRTGERQVFLSRFPSTGDEEWSVSADGGEAGWFGNDNDEILFVNEGVVYRVSFATEPSVRLGAPERLFELPSSIDITDYDGSSRFVGIRTSSGKGQLFVDTSWAE